MGSSRVAPQDIEAPSRKPLGDPVEEGAALMAAAGLAAPASTHGLVPRPASEPERFKVIVIGGGQSGLATGYHLQRLGVPFVILDGAARVGDAWRQRWDSLRLFTPAMYDALDGMKFPAHPHAFPTKDEMGDYLESYARRFALPVRSGVRVEGLRREGDHYVLTAGTRRLEADHVVVAMSSYQGPKTPAFAKDLDPAVVQLHSMEYRSPSQLRAGGVLLVGAGNSGAEIAMELVRHGHPVVMSGRATGHVPFRIESPLALNVLVHLLFRVVFFRLLTVDTPIGRKARQHMIHGGAPLIRVKPKDLKAAGVEWVGRTAGVANGKPRLADGRELDVTNVIWCTGFDPGYSWIHRDVFDADGEPRQYRGVVEGEPGLYFVGTHFLYAMSSVMIQGASRDARYVAERIAQRVSATREA
jgi:putative flavoprotein involved in K+ transport